VRLGKPVTACDAGGVNIGDERIECRTIVWAAGVAASPAAEWLNAEHDRLGRVKVIGDLTVPGHPDIFVIRDPALALDAAGTPPPRLAPVAKQQGHYVARAIGARIAHQAPPPAFHYRHAGNLATVGRTAAVADFGFMRLKGFFAWIVWGLVHIYFLI